MQRPARSLSAAAAISGAVLLATSLAATPAGAATGSGRNALPGSQPAWAKASALRSAAPATDYVNIRVYLGWRGGGAAQQAARDVSTPGSASYRHLCR